MDRLLLFVTCIHLLAFYVTALPIYSGENTSIDDIYDICNAAAINKVISDSSEKFSDFLLSMRNRNDVNAILFALSRSGANEFAETFGKKLNVLGKDNLPRDLLDTINDLRRACVIEYISEKRPSNMKKNAERFEALDSDNFSDLGREGLVSNESGRLIESVKRNRAIGLNPTGWRRRRSDSRDTEDITKFIRNMRELLEKRERLSFNPTGW